MYLLKCRFSGPTLEGLTHEASENLDSAFFYSHLQVILKHLERLTLKNCLTRREKQAGRTVWSPRFCRQNNLRQFPARNRNTFCRQFNSLASFLFIRVSRLLTGRGQIANLLLLNLFLEMIMSKIFAFSKQIHAQRPNSTSIQ